MDGRLAQFLCPAEECRQGVARLYIGGVRLCDSYCWLAYASQRESIND